MSVRDCPRERETQSAARAGAWPRDLAEHARTCDVCREAAAVTGALSLLEENSATEPAPSTAARIWWKAQVAERRLAVEAATRPIRLAQRAAVLVGSASVAAVAMVEWPQAAAYVSRWRAAWPGGWPAVGITPGLLAAVLVAGAALLAAALRGLRGGPDERARS